MNHFERFHEIYDFLKTYQKMWQNEIMLQYPDPLQDYPMDWVKDLARFRTKTDIIRLEKKDVEGLAEIPALIDFFRQVKRLSEVPALADYPPMPRNQFTFLFMIPKKQTEISRLAPVVFDLTQKNKTQEIVDIGGGIGFLAQTLSNSYHLNVTSLDMDPVLQETGKKRNLKNNRNPHRHVTYKTVKVDDENMQFTECLRENVITVGLHTCGPLANSQIRASVKSGVPALINFGCCFQRLEGVPGSMNISRAAQSLPAPLELSHFALTLACRAHKKMSDKDYDLKLKVKLYRYAIHMLLHDEYDLKELVTLGNSSPKLYDESFGIYVLEQLKRIAVTPKHTKEELDQYFENNERQDLLWSMLSGDLIRNAHGRLLELYIVLDRVLYLEENGYRVELREFFDEEESPRNLGIIAEKLS